MEEQKKNSKKITSIILGVILLLEILIYGFATVININSGFDTYPLSLFLICVIPILIIYIIFVIIEHRYKESTFYRAKSIFYFCSIIYTIFCITMANSVF